MEETKTWLNEEFLITAVKSSIEGSAKGTDNNEITIIEHTVKRAVEVGKNFTSTVYRVQVRYKDKTADVKNKKFVIKKLVPAAIDWFGLKEVDTYKILPKIEQLVDDRIAPKVHMATELETVMEDLSEAGFQQAILKLLDYDHCVIAMKALAKLHAGTVFLHRDDPKLIEERIGYDSFVGHEVDNDLEFYEKSFLMFADLIATWPESARYAADVRRIAGKLKKYFDELPQRKAFRVLNHGDFWINNMLFRYEAGEVREVRLVDYQTCRYAPPTADIHYFISSSIDLNVRLNRLDQIYTVYLETLNTTLAQLGVPYAMTRGEFDDSMRADNVFHFIGIVSPLGAVLADPDEKFTLESFEVGEGAMDECVRKFCNLMKSQAFKEQVIPVLDDLEKQGVFERYIFG